MAKWFFLHTFSIFDLYCPSQMAAEWSSVRKERKKKLGQIEKCVYGRPQQSTCKSASFPYRIKKNFFLRLNIFEQFERIWTSAADIA